MSPRSEATVPPNPPRRLLSTLAAWVLAPVLLGALLLAQTGLFRESTSETYDEYTYLRMGICIFRDGDFKSMASPMCPPLPILLEYWLPSLSTRSIPDTEPWEQETPSLIRQARLMTSVLVGLPLVVLVYAWLARRRGWAVGVLGGGLVALSPTIMAAASIATTDACFGLFGVLALASLHWLQVRPSRWSFAAAGAAIGLAVASKQTGIILFPVALVELLLRLPGRKSEQTRVDQVLLSLWFVTSRMAGLVALAFVVDWSLYGFGLSPKFGAVGGHLIIPVFIPMIVALFPNGEAIMDVIRQWGGPLALDTLVGQMDHAANGHHAFLMGRHSFQGWWYFFPVAIAVKSTPAELAMIGVVAVLACRAGTWRDPARRLWLITIAVMLGAGMASSINIGHRYMLLIYPLVALLAADRIGELALGRPTRAIVLGTALLAWQGISAWGIAPHYLAYFNSFCGGPMEGYRYLVDSSLDWGQDLPALRKELEARGYRQVAFCYFGTARPRIYGVRFVDWLPPDDVAAACDWLAISATAFQGAYAGSSDLARRFEGLPSSRAGYSIFLFDLKDPRIRAVWDEIRHSSRGPSENPGAVVTGPETTIPPPRRSPRP